MAKMENIYRPEAAEQQKDSGDSSIFEGWLHTLRKGQVGAPLASGDGVWVNMAAADRELPNSRDGIPIQSIQARSAAPHFGRVGGPPWRQRSTKTLKSASG